VSLLYTGEGGREGGGDSIPPQIEAGLDNFDSSKCLYCRLGREEGREEVIVYLHK
jgi:hypothetical protein